MRKVTLFFLVATTLIGCGKSNQGELVGIKQKKFYPQKPHGMVLIPGGSFTMGSSDEDVIAANDNPTRTVSLRSFWMDETEITNGEYRQFVEWVKDSVIRTELAKAALLSGGYFSVSEFPSTDDEIDENPILAYLPKYDIDALEVTDDEDKSGYQQFLEENFSDAVSNYYETEEAPDTLFHYSLPLNRDVDIIKDRQEYPNAEYARVIEEIIYLPESEWFTGDPVVNTKLLKYRFASVDLEKAVQNPDSTRSAFTRYEVHEIYPDTTVWLKDFKYSYNEPMHNDYFWHQAYESYPVVGINWDQARAFAHWRTKIRNDYLRSRKKRKSTTAKFRLPTEAEWEYAARGGLESATYPWGGPYLTDDRGCFMANFKPKRGNYVADEALYTVEANSFDPNDYGLYNMAGNVSEWTNSTYSKATYDFLTSANPNYDNFEDKQKVVRGGSWKDVAYYLRVASRDYEYADSARSYIGFRLARNYLGTNKIQQ
ncbi:MAG: gliding motility lipoprotein GldK [Flavobacteriaceae bacterium]|nr:gliding motility lipoprotein GldK [Flavobacteriaceae bacterium]|tara:strand:+ start:3160 stop:4611 length:1452 start_codon:yes stop_codon:yes gene_type:complete